MSHVSSILLARLQCPSCSIGPILQPPDAKMHVHDAVETLSGSAARPRRPTQPEKTLKAVKAAGLLKPTKADALKPPCPSKLVGLPKPRKSIAKVESSTIAEMVKKKFARMATVFGECLQWNQC